jgi:hypothetical protein
MSPTRYRRGQGDASLAPLLAALITCRVCNLTISALPNKFGSELINEPAFGMVFVVLDKSARELMS